MRANRTKVRLKDNFVSAQKTVFLFNLNKLDTYSIAMGLAAGGNALGPLFYIVTFGIVSLFISYLTFMNGYKLGVNAIDVIIGEDARRITEAFNTLGIIVVGALAASNIELTTGLKIPMGQESQDLQEVLDGFFPKILPLIMVLLAWYLISFKKITATKVILILTAISAVGVVIGLF